MPLTVLFVRLSVEPRAAWKIPPPTESGMAPPVIFTSKMLTVNTVVEGNRMGVWNTRSMPLPSMMTLSPLPSGLMATPLRMSRSPVAARSSPLPLMVSL